MGVQRRSKIRRCNVPLKTFQQCLSALDYVKDWKAWRGTLHDAVEQGKKMGLSEEQIAKGAARVGDWLSKHVCPATKEEEILTELWNVGTPEERQALASLIVKVVSKEQT
jgi:hypothetical protein